jgi:hypothetical protein
MAAASFHLFPPVMVSEKTRDIKMLHTISRNGRLPLDIRMKCAISHAILCNAGGMHTCRVEGRGDPVTFFLQANGGKRYA